MIGTMTLREMQCCHGLNEDQLEKLIAIADERAFAKDTYVELEGNIAECVYLVKEGRVDIEITLPRRGNVSIYIVEPGGLFGWSAVVPPHIITASSKCIEASTVVEIPRYKLMKMFEEDVHLKAAFYEMICQVIRGRLKETRHELTYLLGWSFS